MIFFKNYSVEVYREGDRFGIITLFAFYACVITLTKQPS